jgi:DNA modification methylase
MKPYKSGTREHLAPFPDELPYRLIKGYSYITETVLDPFLGMGTTLKVAKKLGRKSIGYEINKNYKQMIDSALSQKLLVEF